MRVISPIGRLWRAGESSTRNRLAVRRFRVHVPDAGIDDLGDRWRALAGQGGSVGRATLQTIDCDQPVQEAQARVKHVFITTEPLAVRGA